MGTRHLSATAPSPATQRVSATAPDGISTDDVDVELSPGRTTYEQDLVIDLGETDAPAPAEPRQRGTVPPPGGKQPEDPAKDPGTGK